MESLDPVYSYDGVTHGLLINVYDTLLKFDGASLTDLLPSVSAAVPSKDNGLISADGRTYTFPIRKGIKFQGGEDLTPEDVRYSLLRFLLSDVSGGPSSLLLEPILGVSSTRNDKGEIVVDFKEAANAVRVEGDNVVVTLKRPFAPFLSIVARWGYIVSKEGGLRGAWTVRKKRGKSLITLPKIPLLFCCGQRLGAVQRGTLGYCRQTPDLGRQRKLFCGCAQIKIYPYADRGRTFHLAPNAGNGRR